MRNFRQMAKAALPALGVSAAAFGLLVGVGFLLASDLQAQPSAYPNTYTSPGSLAGGFNYTNFIDSAKAATPTNGVPLQIDLAGAKDLNLEFTFRCVGSNGAPIQVLVGGNNSGKTGLTNIQSIALWSVTAAGTTTRTYTTNLQWNALRYAYILWVTNNEATAGGGLTNWAIYYNAK